LRAPQIIARFLPFSVLLGTLITLMTLNQNSEVIAMKAAGLSAHQVLAPLFVAALGISGRPSPSMTGSSVAPRARSTAGRTCGIRPRCPRSQAAPTNVWVRDGNNLINARARAWR
jgi:lipopolysaccharide export system permease protein